MTTIVTPSATTANKSYEITFKDGKPTGCTCLGFQYRAKCRHIEEYTAEGGWEVFCWNCKHIAAPSVTYKAARMFALQRANRCPDCTAPELMVVPDFEARARRSN